MKTKKLNSNRFQHKWLEERWMDSSLHRQPRKKGAEGRPKEYRVAKKITNQCISRWMEIVA